MNPAGERRSWRARRREQRAESRARPHATAAPQQAVPRHSRRLLPWVAGSALVHLAWLALTLSSAQPVTAPARATPFTLVEAPPPPPPAPVPPPPVESPPPPPPIPVKLVHRAAPPEPLSPPEPVVEAPPEVEEPPPRATGRVRVVGLSLTSTVSNGGAAYAVGNTRMGQTPDEAGDPALVEPLAAEVRPPRRTSSPEPDYPPALRAQKLEGDVGLEVQLDEHGTITSVQVVTASAFADFDRAAVEAARRAVYEPASVNGVARPYSLRFTVRFRLRSGTP